MAENRFKPKDEEEKMPEAQSRRRIKGAASPFFGSLNISAYLVFKNINFIFFLAFLGIIYIANSHYALKVIKEIKLIQTDLEKTNWKSNSIKSELMYESMQSRVLEKVGHLGLKTLTGKPKKIEIDKIKKNK